MGEVERQSESDALVERSNDLFKGFARRVMDTTRLTECSIQGLTRLANIVPLMKAILEPAESPEAATEAERQIKEAGETAEFLRHEVDEKFPTLIAQATVAAWGQLEAFVEDLAILVVQADPSVLTAERNARLKVSLGDLFATPAEERATLVVQTIQRELGQSRGVNQFENLFERLGLPGQTDKAVCDALFELQQVRNVLVHRGAVADRRFVMGCPQFGAVVGERLKLGMNRLRLYSSTVLLYGGEVERRFIVKCGASTEKRDVVLKLAQNSFKAFRDFDERPSATVPQ
jgi:hypothetical protein